MNERRDDWHNSVDERLVNLTSAQKTADDDLDDLRQEMAGIDRVIRGDPEKDLEGLIEAIHRLQHEINKFNAILGPDNLGQGGLLNDIRALTGRQSRREKREGYFWTFFTAVVVQFLILIGLLVVNWDRIKGLWPVDKPAPLERAIEKAKHPKGKKIIRVRVIEKKPDEEPAEAVPGVP